VRNYVIRLSVDGKVIQRLSNLSCRILVIFHVVVVMGSFGGAELLLERHLTSQLSLVDTEPLDAA